MIGDSEVLHCRLKLVDSGGTMHTLAHDIVFGQGLEMKLPSYSPVYGAGRLGSSSYEYAAHVGI